RAVRTTVPSPRERSIRSADAGPREIRKAADRRNGTAVPDGVSDPQPDPQAQRQTFRFDFIGRLTSKDEAVMFSAATIAALLLIAVLGHIMALVWYLAATGKWKLCERKIYDLPVDPAQIRREMQNSVHAPIHALLLALFVYAGFFRNDTVLSFLATAA